MPEDEKRFVPSHPLPAARTGVLTAFDPGTRVLRAGFRLASPFRALPVDVVLDKDVPVRLRDGVTIHVDVLRPDTTEPVPVIVAWSPYGKGQGSSASVMGIFGLVGLDNGIVSGLEKFEGPDPAYWCAHGYAIANPDARGVIDSGGDSVLWDRQEGRDAHDLVEWLAVQPWCSGRVGMSGTSYLAAAQWFAAAEQPPHLAAINPWEGVSDVYRDLVMRGGMPDTGFARQLQEGSFFGRRRKEDVLTEAERHPLVDGLWADKIPDFSRITVPTYVVASYSNTLHTAGTFRAWRRIASTAKWLRIHNTQEWPDYYDDDNVEDLRRFFDRYLRGEDNGWEQTPRVRYSVLDLEGGDRVGLPADEFPPADVTPTTYYLDAGSRSLTTTTPADAVEVGYAVDADPNAVSFLLRFDRDTELVGYPKAHLWVEARDAEDMDLFVLAQKLDAHGTPLQAFTVPNTGAAAHDLTDLGATILRYKGSDGRLRASLRHLDDTLSSDDVPAHTFDRVEKLAPGEIVEIEIDMLPIGLAFRAGQQLRFVVSSRNLLGPMMPGIRGYTGANAGRHVVHTGGGHPSSLRLPVRTVPTVADPRPRVHPEVENDDRSIEHFEVVAARRGLALLKSNLGREGLLALLADEIAAGEAFLRSELARSGGQETSGTTTLRAHGITAAQFAGWLAQAFAREDVLLAGHPEHYSIRAADGRVNIVETLGEHVCSFFMRPWDAPTTPGGDQPPVVAGAAQSRRSRMVLEDGTAVGSVATAFVDDGDGFTAHLSVTLPLTCGPQVVEHHLQHFAVEFRNWILRAATELSVDPRHRTPG